MNKVVLITGGSRGIGAASALLFAEQGYDVCINYLNNHAAAQDIKQQLKQKVFVVLLSLLTFRNHKR